MSGANGQGRRGPQRGAALLLAMIIVALVATLAAGMVWQQWRAIRVEGAERARTQAAWILNGALDWSRLILREDARSGASDHLGEPWATPLAEARLSTFLAADRDNNADGGPEAFLSGAIADLQARYNLRNLVTLEGKPAEVEVATLTRLCAAAGLGTDTAERIALGMAQALAARQSGPQAQDDGRPLAPQRLEQLAWLGVDPRALQTLEPLATLLPVRTPLNLNTAPREVIAAVLGVDSGTAERLVQVRQREAFGTLDAARPHLPAEVKLDPARVSVGTGFFEVSGRLRLEDRILEERSILHRKGAGGAVEIVAIHRQRRSLHTGAP